MTKRKNRRPQSYCRKFHVLSEGLEPRIALSGYTFHVTSNASAGEGTLSAAISNADENPGSTIDFDLKIGSTTIDLLQPLPLIFATVTIDGTSQPGYNGTPLITVNGSAAGAKSSTGFDFVNGSDGSAIRGLEITGFAVAAIVVDGASNVTIGGSSAGQGNVISGNPGGGIALTSTAIANDAGSTTASITANTVVEGNKIGTDPTGSAPDANDVGIVIRGATDNTIGGSTLTDRNIISGNTTDGIDITVPTTAATTRGNMIEGNNIGTNAAGTATLPNGIDGIYISDGAANNTVGGSTGQMNLISGNTSAGVAISGAGTSGNAIVGNDIGTNAAGSNALANGTGVSISQGATNNTIGGPAAGDRNVISGNTGDGIDINGSAAIAVLGNFLGTDATGTTALANGSGIEITGGATSNTIGGATPGDRNVISGNTGDGIDIGGSAGTAVIGNLIGIDATGTTALANGTGVYVSQGATSNAIGGATTGDRNVISGNTVDGIDIDGSAGTAVIGNFIGIAQNGTAAVANGSGIELAAGATSNTIGGTNSGDGNVISGNATAGVAINGAGASANWVAGNLIGTDLSGQSALANGIGVLAGGGSATTVGGTTSGAGNVISGNITAGIELSGATVSGTEIVGNVIGTNPAGTSAVTRTSGTDPLQALQNAGIAIIGSQANTIGGSTLQSRNLISGNYVGVMIASTTGSTNPNQVQGNLIGTDDSGAQPLGNIVGIYINGAAANQVGGIVSGEANVISGNSSVGVEIYGSGSTSNLIEGNIIGLAADGRSALRGSNGLFVQSVGVFIQAASGNLIGGPGAGAGNVISGDESAGVFILSSAGTSQGNKVQGNLIGPGENGSAGPGNDGYGIVFDNAPKNTIVRKGPGANQFGRNGIADVRKYSGPQTGGLAQVVSTLGDSHAAAHPKGPAHHGRRKLAADRATRRGR